LRQSAVRRVVALAVLALAATTALIVSTQLGQRWLRSEAELQLSAALSADAHVRGVTLQFDHGIAIRASGVRVDLPTDDTPALKAAAITATLDPTRLLAGRLRVGRIAIDGLELAVGRDPEGRWSPAFLFSEPGHEPPPDDLESPGAAAWLEAGIAAVHYLLREQDLADHVVLRDAALRFDDAWGAPATQPPNMLRLAGIDARLERSWLLGESEVELTATVPPTTGPPGTLEVAGEWRDDRTDLHLAVAFTGLDLALLRPYVGADDGSGKLAGRASGVIALVTPAPDRGHLELDWSFDGFDSSLSLGGLELGLANTLQRLSAQLTLEPEKLEAESVELQGAAIGLALRGNVSRPLSADAILSLRADLAQTELADLRRLASRLPATEAAPFLTVLDRIQSGRIPRVGLRGGASLRQWQALLSGSPSQLPKNLRLFADIEDVTFGTSPTDTIRDVSAHLTFRGETLEIHELRGRYNDEPLPQVDLAVGGISRLLEGGLDGQEISRRARPVPGLGALWDVVRGDPAEASEESPSPIEVHLAELHHPALRYPLRNADILIDPTQRDLHVVIRGGEWAGQPILGEAILARDPVRELRIELVLDPQAETPKPAAAEPGPAPSSVAGPRDPPPAEAAAPPPAAEPVEDADLWASGHIATGSIAAGPLEFIQVEGDFAVRGQTLSVTGIRADLARQGTLSGAADFDLGHREEVPARIGFVATEAEADVIAQLFGLAPGLFTGSADVEGRLDGPLRPGEGLIDRAVGTISIEARSGKIRQRVPLLAAIAQVAEGWKPSAAGRALRYERIEALIDFDRGDISTERFALDGPMRILASGGLDLNQDPVPIEATLGLFLLRQTNQIFGEIPLVNLFVPGSDQGLIGAYFQVSGPADEPVIRAMPVESVTKGMPLPPVLRGPLNSLVNLFAGPTKTEAHSDPTPEERTP